MTTEKYGAEDGESDENSPIAFGNMGSSIKDMEITEGTAYHFSVSWKEDCVLLSLRARLIRWIPGTALEQRTAG